MTEFKCEELLITDSDSEFVVNIKAVDGLVRCRVYKPKLARHDILVNVYSFVDSKYYGTLNFYPRSGVAVIGFQPIEGRWFDDEDEFGTGVEVS